MREPNVVRTPRVGTRSLWATGSPASGPGSAPRASAASTVRACSRPRSGRNVTMALSAGFSRSICAMCASITSVAESRRARISCASTDADMKQSSLLIVRGSWRVHEAPVREQMPQRVLRFTLALVEPRQIEVRVRETGIEREGTAVHRHRFGLALQILEQHREVERQQRIMQAHASIDFLRFAQPSFQMQDPAEIEPRLQVLSILLEACLVGGARGLGVGLFERERSLELRIR